MIIRKRKQESVIRDSGVEYQVPSIVNLLGGSEVVDVQSLSNDMAKGEMTRAGVPKRAALHLQSLLALTAREMSALLDMSYRTYQRKGDDEMLGLSSTEQLIEIAEVVEHALQVFNTREHVLSWLHASLIGLGGRKPIDLLDNSFGIRAVHQALGRLEHGIFA